MRKKILAAFDDPGGGLAVSTVLDELLKRENLDAEIFAGELSERFVRKERCMLLHSTIDTGFAREQFEKFKPDVLLTGTSGGNAEQMLRNVAFEKQLPSIVILDFWKDYGRRWLYASYPVEEMKDIVCVMDENTKREMQNEKFPEANLIVTGHPYLDRIFNHTKLKDTGVIKSDNHFLFLSQPFETIGVSDYEIHPAEVLVNALKKVGELKNEVVSLTVKLHPSEDLSEELADLVSMNKSDKFDIKFANDLKSVHELFELSDTVIGYNSVAMFEARAYGKRSISLNIAKMNDSLFKAMTAAGIEFADVNENDIVKKIISTSEPKIEKNLFSGGVNNCVGVILNELNLQKI